MCYGDRVECVCFPQGLGDIWLRNLKAAGGTGMSPIPGCRVKAPMVQLPAVSTKALECTDALPRARI